MSPAGLEPATPGFIPLRLSPPRSPRVRGLDYPFTLGPSEAFRCRPSSLYTFPGSVRDLGLARDRQGATAPEAFPEFERIRRAVSHRGAQLWNLGNLCSVQLSYGDVRTGLASSQGTANRLDPAGWGPRRVTARAASSACGAADSGGDNPRLWGLDAFERRDPGTFGGTSWAGEERPSAGDDDGARFGSRRGIQGTSIRPPRCLGLGLAPRDRLWRQPRFSQRRVGPARRGGVPAGRAAGGSSRRCRAPG